MEGYVRDLSQFGETPLGERLVEWLSRRQKETMVELVKTDANDIGSMGKRQGALEAFNELENLLRVKFEQTYLQYEEDQEADA